MADETTMTPVEGAEPPKANPLAKPASSSSTLKLKPVERAGAPVAAAPKPGPATAGLKLPPKPGLATAGLKLPPKPGLATQSGLKLPPKPGLATQSGLKLPPKPGFATTGLKLPPKPGLATAGLKLPPKPAPAPAVAAPAPASAPAPAAPAPAAPAAAAPAPASAPAPAAPAPAAPADAAPAPASAPAPAAPAPAAPAAPASAAVPKPGLATAGLKLPPKPGLATAGLKLPTKPVIRKPGSTVGVTRPTIGGLKRPIPTGPKPVTAPAAAAPAASAAVGLTPVTPTEVSNAEKPLEALKSATQNLKSVTAPIPQQAILRKTGMMAESAPTDAQKQAAKSKTSRISLSAAMGAAPVQNENAPMKTIRIKRPIDIPGATKSDLKSDAATEPAAEPKGDESEPAEASVSVTQRKTLKITRPSGGVVRPSGKFGIKRPGTMMTSKTTKPAAPEPPADESAKPAEGDVADVADIPALPTPPARIVDAGEPNLSKGWSIPALIVQTAACATMGVLAWWLYNDTQILPF